MAINAAHGENLVMRSEDGFTLIELLVGIVVGSLALIAIYQTFTVQHRSFNVQEQLVGLQQNLRAAQYVMSREIRMAGYDPTGSGRFGFEVNGTNGRTSDEDNISFTSDITNDDGRVDDDDDEQVAFRLQNGVLQKHSLGAVTWINVAENIDALDFMYLDSNGNTLTPAAANLGNIRSVVVTMVARSDRPVQGVQSNKPFTVMEPDGVTTREILAAQDDNVMRQMLSTRVKCRNLNRF